MSPLHPSTRVLALHSLALLLVTVLFVFGTVGARAQATANVAPLVGAWTVTEAASRSNVGLRMFFSHDGVFLMVDPRAGIGVAGAYTVGRSGLLINVYGYGRSAEFINGDFTVQGDTLRINVRSSGFMEPQQVTLQRMRLQ